MKFSNRVAQVTQKHYMSSRVDQLLNNSSYLKIALKNAPRVEYTWRDRVRRNLQPIKSYFTLLQDAFLNRHECPSDYNGY